MFNNLNKKSYPHNKYSYDKSISIITLHVADTCPNIHVSSTRLLTERFSVVKCRHLLHPRGKLLGQSPGNVYLGLGSASKIILAVQAQLMCNSCPSCALIFMVQHELLNYKYKCTSFPGACFSSKYNEPYKTKSQNIYWIPGP